MGNTRTTGVCIRPQSTPLLPSYKYSSIPFLMLLPSSSRRSSQVNRLNRFFSTSRTAHSLSLSFLISMASLATCLMLALAFLGYSGPRTVGAEVPGSPDVSPSLQDILDKAHKGPLYTYPTSLTQGIIPKGIHSHNDYWLDVPFYSALSVGAISIEADVWLYNDTLFVGHEISALTKQRTFESLTHYGSVHSASIYPSLPLSH